MSIKLSIALAGIRPQNWLALYNSIPDATTMPKEEYELVITSPYDLPPELQNKPNVRVIKDWGNPTRCYQLAILHSQGEYVLTGVADDVVCLNSAIDKGFNSIPKHHKGVVGFKYHEGNVTKASLATQDDSYWRFGNHKLHRGMPYIPNHYLLMMIGLLRRDYLMEVGGWDCRFEQPGLALPDLAIRLQNDGAEFVLGEKMMDISHLMGNAGDHGPVAKAFKKNDKPLYVQIYSNPSAVNRARIPFDNWKQSPEVWHRRFPGGKP